MIRIPYQKDLLLPETPAGEMGHYLWMNNGYTPAAAFYWAYNEHALRLRLACDVGEPTVFALHDEGNIWEDHCMEFFFQPFPDHPDYFNFECNALGCMIIGKGSGREGRSLITARLKPQLEVCTTVRPGKGWQAEYVIPFQAIEELYGRPFHPQKGDTFRFNMYICGEKTPQMHFGACFAIETPAPDFHRPEYFGEGMFD